MQDKTTPESQAAEIAKNAGVGILEGGDLDNLPPDVSELLNTGRFAEYHLAKARIALANKDFKAARYQISASLRHNPSDPEMAAKIRGEAIALKAEIRKKAKA